MKRWVLVAWVTLATGHAMAQPSDESLATLLERRVSEELAADGVPLARRGLMLHVELVATKLLISIVDVSTGRIDASTKLDTIPADREAAVASITHVAADLVAQITPREPEESQASRDARHRRDLAELEFRNQEIRFVYRGRGAAVPVQGDVDRPLDLRAFFAEVERPDLVEAYEHNRDKATVSLAIGGAAIIASTILLIKANSLTANDAVPAALCPSPPTPACFNSTAVGASDTRGSANHNAYLGTSLVAGGIGLVALVVGVHYLVASPVSEDEARDIADTHNELLRRSLHLPVVGSREHDLQVLPVVHSSDLGLLVAGRF